MERHIVEDERGIKWLVKPHDPAYDKAEKLHRKGVKWPVLPLEAMLGHYEIGESDWSNEQLTAVFMFELAEDTKKYDEDTAKEIEQDAKRQFQLGNCLAILVDK